MTTITEMKWPDSLGTGSVVTRNIGEAPLDFDELLRRCMGKIELAHRLLTSFDKRFPEELAQIEQCLREGDSQRLVRLVHQLKGTTANVSAPTLCAIMTRTEEAARAGQYEAVAACLIDLRHAWDQFQEFKTAERIVPNSASLHRA